MALLAASLPSLSAADKGVPAWTQVNLDSLAEFDAPRPNWSIAGSLAGDPRRESGLVPEPGVGLLVNRPSAAGPQDPSNGHLFTKWQHGDIELELDFLVTAASNSGVYLQGRYEVQICDTWNKPRRPSHDTGSIYQRWDTSRPKGQEGYEGHASLVEAEHAPGLWQHMRILFRAPRFDPRGIRTQPARFERVELNGVLVQQNVEVYGPTRVAAFDEEGPLGPVMLQGDHGAVAYRNIRHRKILPGTMSSAQTAAAATTSLDPNGALLIEHGTCEMKDGRLVEAVAVGSADSIHYCYSVGGGALLKMWRGPFLQQPPGSNYAGTKFRFNPAGSTIELSARPSLGWLSSNEAPWPEPAPASPRATALQYDGNGHPVFPLAAGHRTGTEQIVARADHQGLTRRVAIDAPVQFPTPSAGATWFLLAEADKITASSSGYVIGDRGYYIDLPAATDWKFTVRKAGERFQLIALVPEKATTLSYDMIW